MTPDRPRRLLVLMAVMTLLVTGGCAGGTALTREEAIERVDAVATLAAQLERADQEGLTLLAPRGTAAARTALDEAIDSARQGDTGEAERLAERGLARLERAAEDSRTSADVLREVLDQRQQALAAGSETLLPERFASLEAELRETAQLAEAGDVEDAKDAASTLLRGYSSLELDALKTDATDLARNAIDDARDAGAEKHAPDTFARAKKEASIAAGILETDRSRVEQANVHARRATEFAERSRFVAELVKEFDRRDYDLEDVVLWYQSQLEELTRPLERSIAFDRPNHEALAEARQQIAEAVDGWRDTRAELAVLQLAANESTADLQARLERIEREQREAEARYERVQSLFDEQEAVVYRKGKDVLLETYGFDFPVGQSEIRSNNFPLLNKIAKAIASFDEPRVVVTGHTDATGSDEKNLELSRERAQKVGQFLVEVGGLSATNVATEGFGESKPVASNETEEGRARNRRIEILILNQ